MLSRRQLKPLEVLLGSVGPFTDRNEFQLWKNTTDKLNLRETVDGSDRGSPCVLSTGDQVKATEPKVRESGTTYTPPPTLPPPTPSGSVVFRLNEVSTVTGRGSHVLG